MLDLRHVFGVVHGIPGKEAFGGAGCIDGKMRFFCYVFDVWEWYEQESRCFFVPLSRCDAGDNALKFLSELGAWSSHASLYTVTRLQLLGNGGTRPVADTG